MACNDEHSLHGPRISSHVHKPLPMATQDHLSLAMPTEPQYRTWGELGYAFGGGHGFDTMVLSPGVEASPMLGDWATFSNPFHMVQADGWPLPYHDAAVAAMATPQPMGGSLLLPGDSIASALEP